MPRYIHTQLRNLLSPLCFSSVLWSLMAIFTLSIPPLWGWCAQSWTQGIASSCPLSLIWFLSLKTHCTETPRLSQQKSRPNERIWTMAGQVTFWHWSQSHRLPSKTLGKDVHSPTDCCTWIVRVDTSIREAGCSGTSDTHKKESDAVWAGTHREAWEKWVNWNKSHILAIG